jgi:hypothetical protein
MIDGRWIEVQWLSQHEDGLPFDIRAKFPQLPIQRHYSVGIDQGAQRQSSLLVFFPVA